jgi:hypothetical protein
MPIEVDTDRAAIIRHPNDNWPQVAGRVILGMAASTRSRDPDSAHAPHRYRVGEAVADYVAALSHGDPRLCSLLAVSTYLGCDTDLWRPSHTQALILQQSEAYGFEPTEPEKVLAWLIAAGLRDIADARAEAVANRKAEARTAARRTRKEAAERDEALARLADLQAERDNLHAQVCAAQERVKAAEADRDYWRGNGPATAEPARTSKAATR